MMKEQQREMEAGKRAEPSGMAEKWEQMVVKGRRPGRARKLAEDNLFRGAQRDWMTN